MQVIDTDSHLREEWFLDEVYDLEGEFARYKPKRVGEGRLIDSKFEYEFYPWSDDHKKAFDHMWIYHPERKWLGGKIAELQKGGWDMEERLVHNERAGIDKQFLFPTGISTPALKEGPLGAALARSYNNWVRELVRGHEDKLYPVAIAPAGHPEAMADELRRCVKELGFKAGHLVPHSNTRTLDDEAFFPYYEAAEELEPIQFTPVHILQRRNSFGIPCC